MERELLTAIMAIHEGLVSAPEALAYLGQCIRGDRPGGFVAALVSDRSVSPEAVSRLRELVETAEEVHGSLSAALESFSENTLAEWDATQSVDMASGASVRVDVSGTWDRERVTREHPGRYVMGTELGRGAIGRVVCASDRHLGREVAIKELIPPDPRSPSASDPVKIAMQTVRFLREARVTAKLEHPGIVPVYELGLRPDGSLYYSMQRVQGRTFHDAILTARSLSERIALLTHYLSLCQAIAYAHSQGVIHRDIKPRNILLGQFGETIIIDWGLAKVKDEADACGPSPLQEGFGPVETQETQVGFAVGTPAYMSPEQARGDRTTLDARSDVWALGIVLYEILTGTPPFMFDSYEQVLEAVLTRQPKPPHEVQPLLDRDLSAICMKCLEKDPAKRYQTAADLADDVKLYLSGGRVKAYTYSKSELIRRFASRKPLVFRLILSVIALLLVGSLGIFLMYLNSEANRQVAESERKQKSIALENTKEEQRRTQAARLTAEANNREAHQNLAVALVEEARRRQGQMDFLGGDVFAAAALLHTPFNAKSPYTWPDGEVPAERAEEARSQLADIQSLLYLGRANRAAELAWSTALELPARGSAGVSDSEIRVCDESGTVRKLDTANGSASVVAVFELRGDRLMRYAMSSDGQHHAYGTRQGMVAVAPSDSGTVIASFQAPGSRINAMLFSNDGNEVIYICETGDSGAWNWRTGTNRPLKALKDIGVRDIALSPDGKTMCGIGTTGLLAIVDVTSGAAVVQKQAQHGLGMHCTFSNDGRTIATSGFDGTVATWDARSGEDLMRTRDLGGHVVTVEYLPGDRWLAAGTHEGQKLFLSASSGVVTFRFASFMSAVGNIITSNNNYIAFVNSNGIIEKWNIVEPTLSTLAFSSLGNITRFGFDSTGSILAALSATGLCVTRLGGAVANARCRSFVLPGAWSLAISQNGEYMAAGGSTGTMEIADSELRNGHSEVVAPLGKLTNVRFLPDNRHLAVACAPVFRVYDVESCLGGKCMATLQTDLPAKEVWAMAISPSGQLAAISDDRGYVYVINTTTGIQERAFSISDKSITSINFSPDGNSLVTSGVDSKIRIVDLRRGEIAVELSGHEMWVNSTEFSSDGRLVLSGSDDRTSRLWDIATGQVLLQLQMRGEVLGLAFHPDNRHFALAQMDTVTVYPIDLTPWDADPAEVLAQTEQRLGVKLEGFSLVASHDLSPGN